MRHTSALLFSFLILVACRTATRPSPSAASMPPPAPEGYVVTPHGLVHRSCVREIKSDERVDARGTVSHANGEREQLPPCAYPRLDLHTRKPIVPSAAGTPATINGWVEASDWSTQTPLGSLGAIFPVPSPPVVTGATDFFFPGSEPSDGSTILQPVLQYGPSAAGGGNYWSVASWFCCPAGWSTHSTLVNVNAGDSLSGVMTSTCSGGTCNWNITTIDQTSGTSTVLLAENVASPFLWNFGGVLESYNLAACNQYPPDGTIAFSSIVLRDQNGNLMTPTWGNWVIGGTPACNYTVSATPGTTTLTY